MATFATACATVAACVIADPPTDLPRPAERRPTILHSSVVPSTSAVLGRWPDKFIVPVELSNPNADIAWASFVDFNPVTGEGFDNNDITRRAPSETGNIRTLEIPVGKPSLDRCHVVEIVVALSLNASSTQTLHTPEPPGGDIVRWFYSPSGDLTGCPVLDAGLELDGSADAGTEAGAEAGGTER